jgi:hypothetical protein
MAPSAMASSPLMKWTPERMTDGAWQETGSSFTSGFLNPDGEIRADPLAKAAENTGLGVHHLRRVISLVVEVGSLGQDFLGQNSMQNPQPLQNSSRM